MVVQTINPSTQERGRGIPEVETAWSTQVLEQTGLHRETLSRKKGGREEGRKEGGKSSGTFYLNYLREQLEKWTWA